MTLFSKLSPSVLLLISLLVINSCVTGPRKKPPVQASVDVRKEFEQIQKDMQANADRKALARLKKLVSAHPNTDVSDDAFILMGQIYYKNRDFNLAYEAFMNVPNSDVFSPNEAEALLWAAKSLSKLGRFDEALSLTNRSINIPGISPELKLDNYRLRFYVLSQVGDRLDALRALIFLAENEKDASAKESFRMKAMDFVESRLSDRELETVADDDDFGFVRAYAIFRVGNLAFEQRDYYRARDHFADVVKLLPETSIAERAQNMIAQIDARRKVNSKTIGAVLPLSGRHASVAYRTLRGLQLGLGIYGNERSDFRLAVVDSEGNPDAARRAVERLVTEDHVVAIVGSLLSRTSVAVASKADELGVPSIGLSQKSGLTEIGNSVFRNALTSEMQVRELVRVAMDEMGMKRFAIIYPNDPYGVEYANLFWDEVLARGGEIRAAQTYLPSETDFRTHVQRLVGLYYVEDRLNEYKNMLKEWGKTHNINNRSQPPELNPIIDFDGVFIPDSIRAVGQIAPMLAYYDVNDVRLLGTNLWNTNSLVQRGQRYVEGSLFIDSLLTTDKDFTQSEFYREYKRVFGEEPGIFEAQAYDAALILRQIIAGGESSRIGVMEKLKELEKFPGSVGSLQMSSRREIYRPLVSLTVNEGKILKLDEALALAEQAKSKPAKGGRGKRR